MAIKNETVAIWLGTFVNKEEFDVFTKVHYELIETSKDLSVINSVFDNTFKLEEYDRYIVEKEFQNECKSEYELLKHASYLTDYVSKLPKEISDYNCAILIYDYQYDGDVENYQDGKNKLCFFKNIEYVKDVDISTWASRAREKMRKLENEKNDK
ncbi:MAG: immunity 22 family protein [Coprobacillaceae bacterium]